MTIATNKTRLVSAAAAVSLVVTQLLAPVSLFVPKVGASQDEQKVTICHRTNSVTNPYVQETVAASSVDGNSGNDNGQGDHLLEHTGPVFDVNTTYPTPHNGDQWGDIIPPFDVNGNTYDGPPQTSLNWVSNTTGQAIWNNDCNLPGNVTVNKLVDTNGDGTFESGNSVANQIGFMWGMDGQTPAFAMGATESGITSGNHTITENSLTGYTFKGWYYTNDAGSSCTKPEGTTLPIAVSIKDNQTTNVTLCNQADPGTITIVKDAQPNSDQSFGFNITGGNLNQDFSLTDNGTTSNSQTFSSLTLGSYVVTEDQTSGWTLSDIVCSEGADVSYDKADSKVTITLHPGDSATCTYTNAQNTETRGTLTVYKHTTPSGDPTVFDITATGTSTIDGNADATISTVAPHVYTVSQGVYSVTENNLPAGWATTSNTCTDVVVNADNLNPACDIYNTYTPPTPKPGSITIVKVADPNSDQEFNFNINSPDNEFSQDFTLVDDGSNKGNSQTFNSLDAGAYTVTEQEPGDWALVDISCTKDGKNFEDGIYPRIADDTLKIDLSAGENITCYFENGLGGNGGETLLGIITGHKFNDVNGNHIWDSGEPTLKNWTIKLTLLNGSSQMTQTDANGAYNFTNLQPGNYKVCEVQQVPWQQTYPTTSDGCWTITIDGSGATITADFGNHPLPQVLGESTATAPQLVNTGADASKSIMVGLALLGALGAVHFLSLRRKDYSR